MRGLSVAGALLGMDAFGLGAIGITLVVVWVAESLLNNNAKLLAIGFAVALIPLFCWQTHITSAVSGLTYIQPANDDQQAEHSSTTAVMRRTCLHSKIPSVLCQDFRRFKQSHVTRCPRHVLGNTEAVRKCNASRRKYPGMHEMIPSQS